MEKIKYDKEYFNVADTLECGQVFRFEKLEKGYLSFSLDKCALVFEEGDQTIIECLEEDAEYFKNYFDLKRDCSLIVNSATSLNYDTLKKSAEVGKGIRLLKQDAFEVLFCFIISQNNNIPKIKKSIDKICQIFGEEKFFNGHRYHAFPTQKKLATLSEEDFRSCGVGFRARYLKNLMVEIERGLDIGALNGLETEDLRKKLTGLLGVGRKVADCTVLFGYSRMDCFPVDTWIEKVYKEDFNGKLTDREEISKWFVRQFKENAGYYQQYLFDYKRRIQNKNK